MDFALNVPVGTLSGGRIVRIEPGVSWLWGSDPREQGAILRSLALVTPPVRGQVRLDGKDVATLGPGPLARVRRRIGFAPADNDLPGHLRVGDALAYLAALWQVPGRGAVGRESERWGLAPLVRHRLGVLSPGERRRFVLAASLLMDPDLWILERPFAGLDLPGQVMLTSTLVLAAAGAAGPRCAVVSDTGPPRAGIPCRELSGEGAAEFGAQDDGPGAFNAG